MSRKPTTTTLRRSGSIRVGDTFTWRGNAFTRLPNDPSPTFGSEYIRIRCDSLAPDVAFTYPDGAPHEFSTDEVWFTQRGFKSAEEEP